jgi:hypothetical protein
VACLLTQLKVQLPTSLPSLPTQKQQENQAILYKHYKKMENTNGDYLKKKKRM